MLSSFEMLSNKGRNRGGSRKDLQHRGITTLVAIFVTRRVRDHVCMYVCTHVKVCLCVLTLIIHVV